MQGFILDLDVQYVYDRHINWNKNLVETGVFSRNNE